MNVAYKMFVVEHCYPFQGEKGEERMMRQKTRQNERGEVEDIIPVKSPVFPCETPVF